MKGYSNAFPKTLGASFLILLASGVILVPGLFVFRLDCDFPIEISGGIRTLFAALHLAAGLSIFFHLGALWVIHIPSGWKRRRNRISGVSLCVLIVILGLTGLGGLYLGGEWTSRANAVAHLSAGLSLPILLGFHTFSRRHFKRPRRSGR